jgi:hypothetical protein
VTGFVTPLKYSVRAEPYSRCQDIVFLPLIETLTKIINHTNKETDLKAPHPVIYGGMLNNLSQIFGSTQRAKMTGFLPVIVSTCK